MIKVWRRQEKQQMTTCVCGVWTGNSGSQLLLLLPPPLLTKRATRKWLSLYLSWFIYINIYLANIGCLELGCAAMYTHLSTQTHTHTLVSRKSEPMRKPTLTRKLRKPLTRSSQIRCHFLSLFLYLFIFLDYSRIKDHRG